MKSAFRQFAAIFVLLLMTLFTTPCTMAQDIDQNANPTVDALTADSLCGEPHGRTAIAQLPPVRIVVFDPLSNSFAFVAPCADMTRGARKNDDFLDRHRLALPTQKIRLLIMPYNPLDGDLTLEVTSGQGIEFEPVPSQFSPTIAPAVSPAKPAAASDTTATVPTKPAADEPKVAEALQKPAARDEQSKTTAAIKANQTPEAAPAPPDPSEVESSEYTLRLLGRLESLIDAYRERAEEPARVLEAVNADTQCVRDHMADFTTGIGRTLLQGDFVLAADTTLPAVITEAKRRMSLLSDKQSFMVPCIDEELPVGVEDAAAELRKTVAKASTFATSANVLLQRIAEAADLLAMRKPPFLSANTRVPEDQWRAQQRIYARTVDALNDFHKDLVAGLAAARTAINAIPASHRTLISSLNTPASRLQRFNFPPIPNGESRTFTIRRSGTVGAGAIPARSNSIELRSAPALTVRFGAGIVTSQLANPTFKAGPEIDEVDEDDEPTGNKLKTILYNDRSEGQILPGVFVHNYWSRRSPLLTPTAFERFVPTLSLGLPLAKSNLFEQVLFGFDWELISGVELNLGVHYGKVSDLADGYEVGDLIPATTDITTITEERFQPGFYFGIVLNTESFNTLMGNRQ